jgi:hypothetical protein
MVPSRFRVERITKTAWTKRGEWMHSSWVEQVHLTLRTEVRNALSNQLFECYDYVSGKSKPTPWPESASVLHLPSDRSLSAKLVPTFADRGWNVVSVTEPYGRILGFLDLNSECLLSLILKTLLLHVPILNVDVPFLASSGIIRPEGPELTTPKPSGQYRAQTSRLTVLERRGDIFTCVVTHIKRQLYGIRVRSEEFLMENISLDNSTCGCQ